MTFDKNNGVWRPRYDDKFTRTSLLKIKDFFLDDLSRAELDVARIEKFSNMKLTASKKGFSSMLSVAKDGVKQSQENVKTVNKLLLLNKE